MRDIKFRGLNGDKFVYGSLFKASSGLTIVENGGSNKTDFNFVIPESVGQFTGLQDKNRIDVYSNDRIKVKTLRGFHSELLHEFKQLKNIEDFNTIGSHFIGIVKVDFKRGLMFENEETGFSVPMFSRHKDILSYQDGIEIIGNIHQLK